MNLAALLLPFVVALPPGASAPPPGALPAGAQVSSLDRELGLALVRLPKRGAAPALRRLRAAPGVRYVERDAPVGLAAEGCGAVGPDEVKAYPGWRSAIHLSQRSAAGMLIGIADSGIDDDRLAPRQAPHLTLSAGGTSQPFQDPLGHGTAVASMLVANRPDVSIVGLVPDATLLSARIVRSATACEGPVLEHGLINALGWLRRNGAQVVNVSATSRKSNALVESLRALELSGALVVASVGNGDNKTLPGRAARRARRRRARARVRQEGLVELDARPAGRPRRARRGHQGDRIDRGVEEHPDGRSRRSARRSRRRS